MESILTAITFMGLILIIINIQVVAPLSFYMSTMLNRKLNREDIVPILCWICKLIAIYNLFLMYAEYIFKG